MTQAQVHTGMVFPSAGVRILIPLVVAAFMEEAAGESMNGMSDYNIGVSVGSVAASAFSLDDPAQPGKARFSARDVLYTTFATALMMFSKDPNQVLSNNLWRDAPLLARAFAGHSFSGRQLAAWLETYRPSKEDSRYDSRLLEGALRRRFGDTKISEAAKSFFIVAHGLRGRAPTLFGHIDQKQYRRDPNVPLNIDTIRLHNDLEMVEAQMAATAIPGVIGYRNITQLNEHFMDTGSFATPSYFALMEDMHDLAAHKHATEHNVKVSARNAWRRLTEAAPCPSPVVSRLLVFGVGSEAGSVHDYDTTDEHGVAQQALHIVRAAGDHVTGWGMAPIIKRFDRLSKAVTGAPALRIIDSRIIPETDEERAAFPSTDIKDGRLDNLMKLITFGRKMAIENRDVNCDEILLRMKTLQARGLRTEFQVRRLEQQLEHLRSEKGAAALCDSFLFGPEHVPALLEAQGVRDPHRYLPQPQAQAANSNRPGAWSMRSIASSLFLA